MGESRMVFRARGPANDYNWGSIPPWLPRVSIADLKRGAGVRLRVYGSSAVLAALLGGVFATPAIAQQFAPNEFTVGIDLQTYGVPQCALIGTGPFCQPWTAHAGFYAPAFTYARNLSPSLALEGTVAPVTPSLYSSGPAVRQTLALGGVKTGWRGRRWGLYGQAQAGIASFSSPRQTNFALEFGAAAEYRISRCYSLRADVEDLQIAEFDKILLGSPTSGFMELSPGAIAQHAGARIGITRSFGHLQEAAKERIPEPRTWDGGVIFALQPRILPEFQYLDAYPSWGLWGSWNFSKHLSWDTTLLHSPRNPGAEDIDYQAGGRAFEALSGIKAGMRRDRMGYFVKVRPGLMNFGRTERQIIAGPNNTVSFDDGMFTDFVLDLGGIYEVYPSRHTLLRFEAGDAQLFYLPKTVVVAGVKVPIPNQNAATMLIAFGAGVRF